MRPTSVRACLASRVALGCVLLAAGACGGKLDRIATPGSRLMVDVPAGASRAVLSGVRSTAGVERVAGFSVVDVRVTTPAKTSIKLAVVDPGELTALAASLAAGGSASPESLRAGWLLMSAAERARLGVAQGGLVRLRDGRGSAHAVPVADLTDELSGTGAAGIVARDRVPWLETGRPTMLFVAVASEADPNATATALATKLNTHVNVAGGRPSFLTGHAASQLFGSFSYVVNGDGTIRQDPSWVSRFIVRARVPIFGTVTCHRMMISQLAAALGEVQRLGLQSAIDLDQYGGCYVARKILWDPANPVSMHAWGLAVDFNVAQNRYGARPTMDPRIVEIFERWGFRWGGRWDTPDGMHFELARLIRG